MKFFRWALLVSMLAHSAACSRGSSSSGGGTPPAPPPPPPPTGPTITLPSSPLIPGTVTIPYPTSNFTGTGTGTLTWSVTAGNPPPGLNLSSTGVYSGTPNTVGTFTFTVTLTDSNGSDSDIYTHVILQSVPEEEPNDVAVDATSLPSGFAGTGHLDPDDVDFWSFSATINQIIEVRVYATRHDFDSWQSNVAIPRVTLIGPNGTAFLAGIDYVAGSSTGWYGGAFDLDLPRFRIPANGTYYVQLDHYSAGTDGGNYALRVSTLSLGVLQLESESNNTTTDADAITPGTIRAMKVDDDDDFYSFDITEPTIVYFEIWAYRSGLFGFAGVPDDDYFDPYFELIGPDEVTVLASNDDVFFYDSALSYLIVNTGTYYLRVTESPFPSDGDGEYYLTFTATALSSGVAEAEVNDDAGNANPIAYGDVVSGTLEAGVDDLDFFSFSGTAGDMVRIFWFDLDNHEGAADITDVVFSSDGITIMTEAISYAFDGQMNCVRAILPATGTYYAVGIALGALTDYSFSIELVKSAQFEAESNDTRALADPIPLSGSVAGVIDSNGDVDHYSFQAVEGEVINFSIHAAAGNFAALSGFGYTSVDDYGSLLLPDLEIVNSAGTVLATTPFAGVDFSGESMTSGLATSGITFLAPTAGTFYVRVTASDSTGSVDHLYILEID